MANYSVKPTHTRKSKETTALPTQKDTLLMVTKITDQGECLLSC